MAEFEAFRLAIPFATPLRTATNEMHVREVIVLRVEVDGATGYGEAAPWPGQTSGNIEDAWQRIIGHDVGDAGAGDPLHAAFAAAALDAMARRDRLPLWAWWGGRDRPVTAIAAVGVFDSVTKMLDHVAGLAAAGHREIKLKVAPGHDVEPLQAIMDAFPEMAVGVDANGAYQTLEGAAAVARLQPAYFEQPFPPDRAVLGARLRQETRVTVLADESIWSAADAEDVVAAGAADGVVAKLGRLGFATTSRLLDWARDQRIPVKVSGLFETSVGRSHNLAVATRPEVTWVDFTPAATHLVGDVVADPWTVSDGLVAPRPAPGIGVRIDPDLLARYTTARWHDVRPVSVQEMTGAGEDQ